MLHFSEILLSSIVLLPLLPSQIVTVRYIARYGVVSGDLLQVS